MGIIIILLLIAAFVLALMAALGVASRIGMHALAFALFVLAVILEHVPLLSHTGVLL